MVISNTHEYKNLPDKYELVGASIDDDKKVREIQEAWIHKLQEKQPHKHILVQEIEKDKLSGKEKRSKNWHTLEDCHKEGHTNRIWGRSILDNELLFESDYEDWHKTKEIVNTLINYLNRESIPYISAYSGGKSIHISVFYDYDKVELPDALAEQLVEFYTDVKLLTRRFLAKHVLREARIKEEDIDFANIIWASESKGHLIRCVGGLRENNKYKTFIEAIPENKPESEDLILRVPKAIELWNCSILQGEIIKLLENSLKVASKPLTYDGATYKEIRGINDIRDILPRGCNLIPHGDNNFYVQPHPFEEPSKEGRSFSIDVKKNVWHNFHHGSGGGPLEYVGVMEGIIKSDECVRELHPSGILRGETFKRVAAIAKEKYGFGLGTAIGYDVDLTYKGVNYGSLYFKPGRTWVVLSITKGGEVLVPETRFKSSFLEVEKTRDRIFNYVREALKSDKNYAGFVSFVKDRIDDIVEQEKECREKEKVESAQKEIDENIKQEAEHILEEGEPINFIVKTIQKMHAGNEKLIKLLTNTAIGISLSHLNHLLIVGSTGVGKSDAVRKVFKVLPDGDKIRIDSASEKSFFYAVHAGIDLSGKYIFFDDINPTEGIIQTLKTFASDDPDSIVHWTVDDKRKFIQLEVPRRSLIFGTTIETITDKQGQLLRRYQIVNPDESQKAREEAAEMIGEVMSFPGGIIEKQYAKDIEVSKAIFTLIKEKNFDVLVPFKILYPVLSHSQKTEFKGFLTLIKCVAISRYKHRIVIGDNVIIADKEDFNSAVDMWKETLPHKVDKVAEDVLNYLDKQEPVYRDMDEAEENGGIYIEPKTASTVASNLIIAPRTAREKLENLYQAGLADRKQWKGRGSPYCYWVSPTITPGDTDALRQIELPKISKEEFDKEILLRLEKLNSLSEKKFDASAVFLSLSSISDEVALNKKSEEEESFILKKGIKTLAKLPSAVVAENMVIYDTSQANLAKPPTAEVGKFVNKIKGIEGFNVFWEILNIYNEREREEGRSEVLYKTGATIPTKEKKYIKIPFNDWSRDKLNKQLKTATTRTKKYGNPMDRFIVDDVIYELDSIEEKRLGDAGDHHYKEEGADSTDEFIEVWKDLHPKKGYVSNQLVLFHTFQRIEEAGVCICGEGFDTIEDLHRHQANCREFQAKQDREAKVE